ncbi:unnamed protein product, partial [Adineta steineri]
MPFQTMGSGGSRIGSAHGGRFTGEFMATRGAANGRPIYEGSRGGQYHMTPGDQFYSIHGILGYHDDGCVRVDENSIPRGIVNHRALRHLEIECVNSIDLFEFLESLLRCVPGLQQLQVTICPIEGFQISFHNIARLLQNYVSSLNYFHCKIPITNVYPCAIDQILHGSIHSIHLLFANVEMNNEYIIISSA